MTTQDDPAKLDPALPGWWAFWDEYAERSRRPWASVSQGDMPDPNVDPELHQLARDDFGFRDAGRRDNEPPGMLEARLFLKWPGSPRSKTEALSMKRRKLTEIEVVGPDASAIGWEAAPAMRALRLLHVYATMDPGGAHFALARAVVSTKKEGNEATDDEVDRLARALAQHAQKLARELGWDGPGLAERLPLWTAEELGYGSEDERLQLFYGRRVDAKTIGLDGSLDRVADFLARIGENGQRLAKHYRGKTDPSLWVRPDGPRNRPNAPTRSPVMWSLAVAVWFDQVQPDLGKVATAKHFRLPTEHEDGHYVMAPKPLSALTWALGGYGERVEIEGDEYRPAPGLARYAPRLAALPSGQSPAQRYLQLDTDDGVDDGVPMEIRVAADARMVLSESAGKLSVLLMTTASQERLQRLTVGELTRLLNPPRGDKSKRYQGRDYEATIRALNSLKSLAIVPPRYSPINLFDLTCPKEGESDPTLTVLWGFSKALDAMLTSGGAELPSFGGKPSWSGKFLLNLTKAMLIPTNQSQVLRLYVYAAARINEMRLRGFDAMPWITAEELARVGNTVSQAALDYARERDGDKRRKVRLSEALTRVDDALDYLQDEALVIVEKNGARGTRRRYRMKPTKAFEAAYQKIRRSKSDS